MLIEKTLEIPSFENFANESKVWIYQADRLLSTDEVKAISEKLNQFSDSWESHGSALNSKAVVVESLFLVFVVDETRHEASGCSVDKSVHFVKEIEQAFGVNFFNRMNVAYYDDKYNLKLTSVSSLEEDVNKLRIGSSTLVFNNLCANLASLRTDWLTPIENTWLSKYLK